MPLWLRRTPGLVLAVLFALVGLGWIFWRVGTAGGTAAYLGVLFVLVGALVAFATLEALPPG